MADGGDLRTARAQAYDLVLNGTEIGGALFAMHLLRLRTIVFMCKTLHRVLPKTCEHVKQPCGRAWQPRHQMREPAPAVKPPGAASWPLPRDKTMKRQRVIKLCNEVSQPGQALKGYLTTISYRHCGVFRYCLLG